MCIRTYSGIVAAITLPTKASRTGRGGAMLMQNDCGSVSARNARWAPYVAGLVQGGPVSAISLEPGTDRCPSSDVLARRLHP
jgi:hypothetical protein